MLDKLFASITKFLHAHAAGGGAALVLLLDKLTSNAPLDKPAWAAIAAAYLGVGGLVSALPHGGQGAELPPVPGDPGLAFGPGSAVDDAELAVDDAAALAGAGILLLPSDPALPVHDDGTEDV